MDVHRLRRRIERYRGLDERLAERAGGWAADPTDAAAAEYWATLSERLAWHAELWAARHPDTAQTATGHVAAEGGDDGTAWGTAMAGLSDELAALTTSAARLSAVARVVLLRLVGVHRTHLATTDARLDAPTVRTLTLVLRDLDDAWRDGEALLQQRLGDAAAVADAAAVLAAVEARWLDLPWDDHAERD
jgi:hypothetical protein